MQEGNYRSIRSIDDGLRHVQDQASGRKEGRLDVDVFHCYLAVLTEDRHPNHRVLRCHATAPSFLTQRTCPVPTERGVAESDMPGGCVRKLFFDKVGVL